MKGPEIILTLMFGFICLIIGAGLMESHLEDARNLHNQAQQVKTECEADLPRSQQCKIVITAVVDDESNK